MGTSTEHWDGVYTRLDETQVSWFLDTPTSSLELLDAAGVGPQHSVVDVGAGAARLVDALLQRGFTDLTALDVSDAGLARARRRLGPAAAQVRWEVADLLDWTPGRSFEVWHDRAVFHFLVDPDDRARYREVLTSALAPGALVVVGTFAQDGPQRCSDLPVARYDADGLAEALGDGLEVLDTRREEHRTPWDAVQTFTWLTLRRRS